jgi:histidine triad (HIT) family protein
MENCIFCKIINKEVPSEAIFEDENFLVIPDKYPKAEIHILFMPKKHIHSVAEAQQEDAPMMGQLLFLAKKIAQQKGISDFKLIFNNGKHAEIPHMHLHLVAGNDVRPLPV